jgi:3'(2'), 5'-bisphosphate nucleotidase
MAYELEKQIAIAAVTQAARLCQAVQSEMVKVDSLQKGDKSPVTIADFGSQALVCQQIKANFPQDVIVAEEDSADLRKTENLAKASQVTEYVRRFHPRVTSQTVCGWIDAGNGAVSQRFWTLDPIDGTKGFLRNEQYGIALALIEEGEVKVAALACPALPMHSRAVAGGVGVIFVAARGEGSAMARLGDSQFTPIHVVGVRNEDVGQTVSLSNLRFVESVEAEHGDHRLQQMIAQAVGITQPSLRMDSQAKYGAVARGDAALYLRLPSPKSPNYREKIWDHAAGSLIVEEAGGRVSDIHGQPLDFASDYKMNHNQGVVVSNGVIHEAVLEALRNYKI